MDFAGLCGIQLKRKADFCVVFPRNGHPGILKVKFHLGLPSEAAKASGMVVDDAAPNPIAPCDLILQVPVAGS